MQDVIFTMCLNLAFFVNSVNKFPSYCVYQGFPHTKCIYRIGSEVSPQMKTPLT